MTMQQGLKVDVLRNAFLSETGVPRCTPAVGSPIVPVGDRGEVNRSRREWDLPNGMKPSMLRSECQAPYATRVDEPFRSLLEKLDATLTDSKVIRNPAHPDKPELMRSAADPNVVALQDRIREALTWIAEWLVFYELFLLTGKWLGSETPHASPAKSPERVTAGDASQSTN